MILNTICLSFIFFSEKIIYEKNYFFEFCFLFLFLIIFIVNRYFFETLITKKADFWKKIKPLIFKNFTLNLQYAYLYFALIIIGFYNKIPSSLLNFIVSITLIYGFYHKLGCF